MQWAQHRRVASAALVFLAALASCLDREPTASTSRLPEATLLVRADLSGTPVATVEVVVTAPDIPTPLVFNIPIVDRAASGAITVPAGSGRTITINAFDAGGTQTHSGSVTVNVRPGANPLITLVLEPLAGSVPITATLGSFTVTVAPALDSLTVADTVTLRATIRDANGNPVAASVTWGATAPAVASVVSTGQQTARVTANRPGSISVVASFGGTAGPATIVVAGWFASPTGSSTGDGSSRPWDLATALAGGRGAVHPGDTVWLRGGTYAGAFTASLTGTPAAPVVVRQYRGERATLDGGSSIQSTLTVDGQWATYWGFEVMQSGTVRSCDSCLAERPVGVFVRNASQVKLINLIVHDVGHGVFTLNNAHDIEIYGWIIYNGGGQNLLGRPDGHGIYIKNDGIGWKIARDNVIFNQFGMGVHAFTDSGGGLQNLLLDGNALFNNGTLSTAMSGNNLLLGGRAVADNDSVTGNMLYVSPSASPSIINARLGFQTLLNGTVAFHDNYIVGSGDALDMGYWQAATVENNTLQGSSDMVVVHDTSPVGWQWRGNQYWRDPNAAAWAFSDTEYTFAVWQAKTGLGATDQATPGQPTMPQVFVRPNQYERGRAHVVIYNWSGQGTVPVDLSNVIHVGDRYEVRNVQDVFGTPVLAGTFGGGAVGFPMTGVAPPPPIGGSPLPPFKTAPSFDVFLVTSSATP